MSKERFFVCVFSRRDRKRPYRWRMRPRRSLASEQTARRTYQAVRLTKLTRMKVLIRRAEHSNTLVESEGWHTDATTVMNLGGETTR
jgi:hypothetical protein